MSFFVFAPRKAIRKLGSMNLDSWKYREYQISSNISKIDWPRVHRWLASSYWTPGIPFERVKKGGKNSALVLGVYDAEGEQVAYSRVISDKARFAYLADVWVDKKHRGKGIGSAMVRTALEHPDFKTVSWLLATKDAHGVYAKLGFEAIKNPERWMGRGAFCENC